MVTNLLDRNTRNHPSAPALLTRAERAQVGDILSPEEKRSIGQRIRPHVRVVTLIRVGGSCSEPR